MLEKKRWFRLSDEKYDKLKSQAKQGDKSVNAYINLLIDHSLFNLTSFDLETISKFIKKENK